MIEPWARSNVKKFTLLVLLLLAVGIRPAAAADEEEEGRTLQDRIKSVSSRLYLKSGRMEITLMPMTSLSLNDAFYQKFGGGFTFGYHFSDAWAAQLMATYSLNVETSNAAYFGRKEETSIPYAGKRTFLFGADAMWSPLYGKVNLASEWVMHFDTYLMLGLGGVGGDQMEGDTSFAFAGSFGLGLRLFFTRSIALRLELKDYMLFNDKVTFGNQEKSDVQHQLLANIGLSIFFLDGDREE